MVKHASSALTLVLLLLLLATPSASSSLLSTLVPPQFPSWPQDSPVSQAITGPWSMPAPIYYDGSYRATTPQVAVDSGGRVHAVWQNGAWPDTLYYAVREAGDWSTPRLISDQSYPECDPQMVVGLDDKVHIAWLQGEWPSGVYYTVHSADSWSNPIDLSNSTTPAGCPRLAVDSNGDTHVVWAGVSSPLQIFHTAWEGNDWSEPTNISNTTGDAQSPQVVVGPNGNVHVIWEQSVCADSSCNGGIFHTVRSFGSWSPPMSIPNTSGFSYRPKLAVDSGDQVHVIWEEWLSTTRVYDLLYTRGAGTTWMIPFNISNSLSHSRNFQIAMDGNDKVHVIWQDGQAEWLGDTIRYATGSGTIWSEPITLSNPSRHVGNPYLAVEDSNNVHAVWQEQGKDVFEKGFGIAGDDDVYYTVSSGGTWSRPFNVTNMGSHLQVTSAMHGPHLAIGHDHSLHLVWVQQDDPPPFGSYTAYYATCATNCTSYDRSGSTPWWRGIAVASVRDAPTEGVGSSTSLQNAQNMHMGVVLHYLGWDTIEIGNGVYDWDVLDDILKQTDAYGLPVVLRVYNAPIWRRPPPGDQATAPPANPNDIREFMYRLVDRVENRDWRDRVAGYVIWNEPNIPEQWGGQPADATAYVSLLCAAYEGAKLADPDARIVSAGLAPTETGGGAMSDFDYLAQMYDAGLANCADMIGMQGLGFGRPPDDTSPDGYNFRRLERLHQVMLDKGDTAHKVWALEVGWLRDSEYDLGEAFNWRKVSEEQQAEYLEETLAQATANWRDWLDLIVIWNLDFDRYYPPTSNFHWYAIQNATAGERLQQLKVYLPVVFKSGALTQ
jgi:hypothetical protein